MTEHRTRSRSIGARGRGASRRLSPSRPDQWISIQVELVEGRGKRCWPRPGRIFAAATLHSFAQLATAIDEAFARWDRSHLHEFTLGDGTRVAAVDPDVDDSMVDEQNQSLARLNPGEQFVYVFDFGDDWAHLCTVGDSPIDPLETVGLVPDRPLAYFGWGAIPDQYRREWSADDGDTPLPPDLGLEDLPALRPDWGPRKLS